MWRNPRASSSRARFNGPASIAFESPGPDKLSDRFLGPFVVPGDEDVERLTADLAFDQGAGEGGVEGLDHLGPRRRLPGKLLSG